MQLFRFPYNYEAGAVTYVADSNFAQGVIAPELSDGRTDTFNAAPFYIVDFAGTDRKAINSIFVVSTGYDTVSMTWDAGAGSGGSVTDTPISGADVRRGVRHYASVPHFTMNASRVRLQFDGGPGRIYNVALTQQVLNIPENMHWTRFEPRRESPGAAFRTNLNGNSVVIPARAGRWKWRTDITGFFGTNANPSADQILATVERYPNMFVWPRPTGDPTRFYPATVDPASVDITYFGRQFTQQELNFTLQEL